MADDRDKLDLLPPHPPVPALPDVPAADLLPPSAAPSPEGAPPAAPEPTPSVEFRIEESRTPQLSPADKAQRRTQKNLVLFGVCIVVLVIVFYFLTR